MSLQVKITGAKGIASALNALPKELMRSAETAVLRAGAKPIEKAAKANAPVGKGSHAGLLKKSIGSRVKSVNGEKTARVGPRTGFKVSLGTKIARVTKGKRIKGKPYEAFKDPNKYSHLVEFGSSRSAAQPFIRPAIDSASGSTLNAMSAGLEKHLDRVAKRLAKKGVRP